MEIIQICSFCFKECDYNLTNDGDTICKDCMILKRHKKLGLGATELPGDKK